jgi:cryptochrome 1
VQALKELVQETGAQAVFFNHLYDSISMVRDQQVKDELRAQGVLVSTFNADLLYEPWEVLDDQQQVSFRPQRQAVLLKMYLLMV